MLQKIERFVLKKLSKKELKPTSVIMSIIASVITVLLCKHFIGQPHKKYVINDVITATTYMVINFTQAAIFIPRNTTAKIITAAQIS